MNKKLKIVLLALLYIVLINAEGAANNSKKLTTISKPLKLIGVKTEYKVLTDNSFTLTTEESCDMYISPEGDYTKTNAPLLLFSPSVEFVLTTAIECKFNDTYQGASIILYNNEKQWVKFLFELNHNNKKIVCSNFTNNVSSDDIHIINTKNKIYLRIAKKSNFFVFYISEDNKNWDYYKMIQNPENVNYKLGFSIQSPEGKKFSAKFSDVKYSEQSYSDFWTGN